MRIYDLGFTIYEPKPKRGFFSSSFILHSSLGVVALALMAFGNPAPSLAQTTLILSSNATPPTVGMEGQLDVALPLAGLTTKATDHRTPLLLRVASTQPHGTLTRYDLRYIGRVPGKHDLRNYLFAPDGSPATNLPALTVAVAGLLPDPHSGWLEEQARQAPSLFSGYRAAIIVVCVLWGGLFFVIRRLDRKPKPAPVEKPAHRTPTFAEKIRPLVERAASGQLTADEKAALERMLITHWQQRLNLTTANGNELIGRLRQHNEAGVLLQALEDWLHRPPGRGEVKVENFLAPYRNLPDEKPAEVVG